MGARKVFVLFLGFPLQKKFVQEKLCSRGERINTASRSCTIHIIRHVIDSYNDQRDWRRGGEQRGRRLNKGISGSGAMADVRNECFPCDLDANSGALEMFLLVAERQRLTTMTADVLF